VVNQMPAGGQQGNRAVKRAAGVISGGIAVGVSYWVHLFYRTIFTDYRWPAGFQNATLFVSFLVAVAVSIAGSRSRRLEMLFWWAFGVTAVLLVISFFIYLVSKRHDWWQLNSAWQGIDLLAMASLVATISLGSQISGSSIWQWFTGGGSS
jgi:heme/copper-type cytochrome/quinol oxidase subunit 4